MIDTGLEEDVIPKEAVSFINKYTDPMAVAYMVEPKKGAIYYNIKDAVTRSYMDWFNPKNDSPKKFKEKLKESSDMESGMLTVTTKSVTETFGFHTKDAEGILSSCSYLKKIKDTDTFYFKDDGNDKN